MQNLDEITRKKLSLANTATERKRRASNVTSESFIGKRYMNAEKAESARQLLHEVTLLYHKHTCELPNFIM